MPWLAINRTLEEDNSTGSLRAGLASGCGWSIAISWASRSRTTRSTFSWPSGGRSASRVGLHSRLAGHRKLEGSPCKAPTLCQLERVASINPHVTRAPERPLLGAFLLSADPVLDHGMNVASGAAATNSLSKSAGACCSPSASVIRTSLTPSAVRVRTFSAAAAAVSHGHTFDTIEPLDQGAPPRRYVLLPNVVVPGPKRMPDGHEHIVVGEVEAVLEHRAPWRSFAGSHENSSQSAIYLC
jgi:hypothetical protein